jgi:hypothetical protein
MKKLAFILSFIYQISNAATYYVAPDGNNSYPGTISQPWKTWTKAFNTAVAGDTVYFRGGVYYSISDNGGERGFNNGTLSDWICFFNYPGEIPILDCSNHSTDNIYYNKGIALWNAEYIHIKGLQIRNVYQGLDGNVSGIELVKAGNIILENIVLHHINGVGLTVSDFGGTVVVKNCDAYNLCDSLRTAVYPTPGSPGQNGVGFQWINHVYLFGKQTIDSKLYFEGCRAWNFSDNGFAGSGDGYVGFDRCWAFNGGELSGEGCGWKLRATTYATDSMIPIQRYLKNCIGAINGGYGFSPNNNGYPAVNLVINNCAAYHNGYKGTGNGLGHGFVCMNYSGEPAPNQMFKNCISYDNEFSAQNENYWWINDIFYHEYNSWNNPPNVNVDDDDFVSLDWTEMLRPRKADGSLPDINFMKLAEGSDLIDAGVDVGLPFYGNAPDIGVFEYTPGDTTLNQPPVIINIPNQTIAEGESFIAISLNNFVSDPDNNNEQLTWSCSGNSHLTVSINQTTKTATIVSNNPEWNGSETITFTATDPEGLYDTDQAIFSISILNSPPEIENQDFTINLEEFSGNLIGTIIASDPDQGQVLTFSIINGNESGLFVFNSESGELRTSDDFYLTQILPEYNLSVMVEDNGESAQSTTGIVKVTFLQKQLIFYIDPENGDDQLSSGTLEHPFSSWSDITWEDGITCLQKKGTTSYESKININASNITIGSYGEGERPVIQSMANDFAIRAFEANNLYIKDLHIVAMDAISCIYILGSTGEDEIENCILEAADNGIRTIDTKSTTICYNTITDCFNAIYSFSEVNKIYYNVFRNNQVVINITSYLSETEIFNNVFYNNSTGVAASYSDLTLYNNIFHLLNKGDIAINAKLDKLISDYNIFYPEQDGFITVSNVKYNTLAEFQKNTGLDLNSFNLNPKFVDVYNDNFTVDVGSPAIDAGVTVGLNTDFYGAKVPYGKATDIGLAEAVTELYAINETIDNQNVLNVFPNPSNGKFNINLEGINRNALKASIVDITGRIFYEKYFFPDESELFLNIDISYIPEGIYMVILITDRNEKYYERIIIK